MLVSKSLCGKYPSFDVEVARPMKGKSACEDIADVYNNDLFKQPVEDKRACKHIADLCLNIEVTRPVGDKIACIYVYIYR